MHSLPLGSFWISGHVQGTDPGVPGCGANVFMHDAPILSRYILPGNEGLCNAGKESATRRRVSFSPKATLSLSAQ